MQNKRRQLSSFQPFLLLQILRKWNLPCFLLFASYVFLRRPRGLFIVSKRTHTKREKKVTEMAEVEWNNQRSKRMIEEQAKEELEILETQYPNRFEYLKLELKSFIFQIQSQSQLPLPENYSPSCFPTSSIATTQGYIYFSLSSHIIFFSLFNFPLFFFVMLPTYNVFC